MLIKLIRKLKEDKHMKQLKLESPWYTWQKKIKALFGVDTEVNVNSHTGRPNIVFFPQEE